MISVCMTTYNGAAFVKKQIDSILPQLAPDDELIVSDDGSTDGTLEILQTYGNRLQVHRHNGRNLVGNFENALSKACGDYIFLADQDDIWQPNKVALCLEAFQKGARLVVSDCALINEHDDITAPSYYALKPPHKTVLGNVYKNSFVGCCMAFDKKILRKALPFPPGIPMHDSWIGLLALTSRARVTFLDEKLVLYRRHGGALSTTGYESTAPLRKKILDRLQLMSACVVRFYGIA